MGLVCQKEKTFLRFDRPRSAASKRDKAPLEYTNRASRFIPNRENRARTRALIAMDGCTCVDSFLAVLSGRLRGDDACSPF